MGQTYKEKNICNTQAWMRKLVKAVKKRKKGKPTAALLEIVF